MPFKHYTSGSQIGLSILFLSLTFSAGVISQWAGAPRAVVNAITNATKTDLRLPPPPWRNPFVLVVVGQSNVANHGTPRGRSGGASYAAAAKGIYRMEDPLPGASGSGVSPWPYWAAQRLYANSDQQLLVVLIAQSSSAVADWAAGGVHARRLPEVLAVLHR